MFNTEVILDSLKKLQVGDVVYLSDITVMCKTEIIKKITSLEKSRYIKGEWLIEVKNAALKIGVKVVQNHDNWVIVERLFLNGVSETTTSSIVTGSTATGSSSTGSTATGSTATGSTTTCSEKTNKSSLGSLLTVVKKEDILLMYQNMNDEDKWKLASGRNVEDIMHEFVKCLNFEHPACEVVLDIADKNWSNWFLQEEVKEIQKYCKIDHVEFPLKMQQFLDAIPNSNNIQDIFAYICKQNVDAVEEPGIYWLKTTLESIAYLFITNYLPITDQNERDLMRRVWLFIDTAFDTSDLKLRVEKESRGSKLSRNKKRKLSAVDKMERQATGLIPDMLIFYDKLEFGFAEVAKEDDNTKELVEGGNKCSSLMLSMFSSLCAVSPTLKNQIKITGFLISRLKLTPMQLCNPIGYVKIMKRGDPLLYPLHSSVFCKRMFPLLELIWVTKLEMEKLLQEVL